ncbi:MAG TPA: lysozyme inhibitor LprI family protein [Acidimicrobiales bacterium]|nr:lysozyme inhibitor LprI family protein [Acidimicrobiales bacterium]
MRYRKTAAAAASLLGLGVAGFGAMNVDAVVAGAGAAGNAPPVVTETFGSSPLVCDPNTTVGMEGCGEHKVLADDRQLNADIRVIWARLTATGKADFAKAQADWLAYRRADCQSQSDLYQGGSEQPVAFVYCLASDDRSRHQDLAAFFAQLTQGESPRPSFP